jgi:hypothetical protein
MPAGRKAESRYHPAIAKRIQELVQSKVKISHMIAMLNEEYETAPQNEKQLRKFYGDTIAAARGKAVEQVGKKVYDQAVDGHFPSQEMFLTTQDDWSKKEQLGVTLEDDEDNSAIATILAMLGKDKKD